MDQTTYDLLLHIFINGPMKIWSLINDESAVQLQATK